MKAALRRKQILESSKKIFAAKGGYYEAYVEDVIKAAKIGKGTFYQYFKNKEDLFVSVLDTFLDDWEVFVARGLADSNRGDVFSGIHIFIFNTFLFFQKNEQLCHIYLCNGPGLNPVFVRSIAKFEDRILTYIETFMKESMQAGAIRKDLDLKTAANIFLGAFLRLAYYNFVVRREKQGAEGLQTLADEFFDIAMRGIKN
ncbi:MAG: TetR/AcrR family transcriptional regulator [Desulfobacterales bacterium]|nr:TetR/AcrR family transcriptional regulator [Desulfobacterales bacterium]